MMSLLQTSVSTIAAILAAMAVVALLETGIPLPPRGSANRAHLVPNLTLTFITFATNIVLNGALMLILLRLDAAGLGILRMDEIAPWLAFAVSIVVLDLAFYVAHVVMHKVPAL